MDLPPELLQEVLRYLLKNDLEQMRLVCKALSELGAPHLFHSIFLSANVADLEDARLSLTHFKHYIRTVIISPMYLETLSESAYRSEAVAGFQLAKATRNGNRWQEHLDLGFEAYCRQRQEAFAILSTGEISKLFCEAAGGSSNIHKVVFTNAPRQKKLNKTSVQEYCPIAACKIPCETHENFRMIPRLQATGFGDGKRSLACSVIEAFSTTTPSVKELTAEFIDDDHHFLTPSAFEMTPRQTSRTSAFVANLTKLRLCLTVNSLADEHAILNRTVAKVLSNACNMRCLFIEIGFPMGLYTDQTGTTAFQATLNGCSFPKLRAFILAFGSARQDELVSLFEKSPLIEVLVFDGMTLQSGFWKEVVESARQHLPIKTIQMNQLFRGFEEPWARENLEWMDYFHDVGNFIFHDGPNPFSVPEVARYRQDLARDRPLVVECGGRSYEYYYPAMSPRY